MLHVVAAVNRLEKLPVVVLTMPIGDPTVFGNLPVHEEMKTAVKNALDSGICNGYGPAQGTMHKSM